MKTTPLFWWCICTRQNLFSDRHCCQCGRAHYEKYANVRAEERAVVYYNPATGEHKTPPRADQPMPQVYAIQGFERREIDSMISWEKESGVVHEATNFNSGNEIIPCADPTPKADPKLVKALAEDMASAFASGEWTGAEKLV